MTENNNLFQLAQVVTELPMHQQPSSPMPHARSNEAHHPLVARKVHTQTHTYTHIDLYLRVQCIIF